MPKAHGFDKPNTQFPQNPLLGSWDNSLVEYFVSAVPKKFTDVIRGDCIAARGPEMPERNPMGLITLKYES
jgi:hypothetical protein